MMSKNGIFALFMGRCFFGAKRKRNVIKESRFIGDLVKKGVFHGKSGVFQLFSEKSKKQAFNNELFMLY